jgi:hypothetical protein
VLPAFYITSNQKVFRPNTAWNIFLKASSSPSSCECLNCFFHVWALYESFITWLSLMFLFPYLDSVWAPHGEVVTFVSVSMSGLRMSTSSCGCYYCFRFHVWPSYKYVITWLSILFPFLFLDSARVPDHKVVTKCFPFLCLGSAWVLHHLNLCPFFSLSPGYVSYSVLLSKLFHLHVRALTESLTFHLH